MYLIICAPIEFRCEVLRLEISEWLILAVSDPVSRGLEIQFLYCQTTDSVTPLKRGPPLENHAQHSKRQPDELLNKPHVIVKEKHDAPLDHFIPSLIPNILDFRTLG